MRVFAAILLLIAGLAPAAWANQIQRVVSPGGIEAWLIQDQSLPIIALSFSFAGGTSADPQGKEGRANLAAALLAEGAGPLDTAAFNKELADLSIGMSFSAGTDRLVGGLQTITANADRAFEMLTWAITDPLFDPAEVERTREQIATGIRRRVGRPGWLSRRAFFDIALPGHPYSRPSRGRIDSLGALTIDDLRAYTAEQLVTSRLTVGVAGDISPEELGQRLDQVFGSLPEGAPPKAIGYAQLRAGGRTVLVDHESPQSLLYLAQPGMSREDPDYFAAVVMNHILGGGGFASRLTQEVREKRGLTYGISSSLTALDYADFLTISADVSNENVLETLQVIRDEWDRMATEGATQAEIDDAIAYITGSFPLLMTDSSAIAGLLHSLQVRGRPIDYLEIRNDLFQAVDREAVNRVAKRMLKSNSLVTVITGTPPDAVASDIVVNAAALTRRELGEDVN
ncbi:MAG: pitrilysin family protein [Pseudomonadota bacterium]